MRCTYEVGKEDPKEEGSTTPKVVNARNLEEAVKQPNGYLELLAFLGIWRNQQSWLRFFVYPALLLPG